MRWLICKLFRLNGLVEYRMPIIRHNPQHLKPVKFDGDEIKIEMTTIRQLEHLHTRGMQLRETQEALASECCELLGIDPRSMGCEADFARSIVDGECTVSDAIEQISLFKQTRRNCVDL